MKPNCKWLNRGLCFSWVKMSRGGLWFCSPVMPWFWVNFFAVLLVFLSWLQDGFSSSKHIFFTWQCLYVASLKGMPETEACVQCLGEVIIGSRSKEEWRRGGDSYYKNALLSGTVLCVTDVRSCWHLLRGLMRFMSELSPGGPKKQHFLNQCTSLLNKTIWQWM